MKNNNKYYWIKLKTDFFNQETIDFLLSQKNGCEYIVLYQMLCLHTANTNGEMVSRVGEMMIPYDINKIVRDTKYFDFDTVTVALELFKNLGLIYEQEDKLLKIANFEAMVGYESANREAVKKREQRLKKKIKDNKGDMLGTNCPIDNRDKILDIRDIDIEKDIEEDKDKEKETLYDFLQQNGFVLSPFDYEVVGMWEDNDLTRHAIAEAILNGKLSCKYVDAIIRNFKNKNIQTVEQAKEDSAAFKKNKAVVRTNPDWLHQDIEENTATQEEIEEFEKILRGDSDE